MKTSINLGICLVLLGTCLVYTELYIYHSCQFSSNHYSDPKSGAISNWTGDTPHYLWNITEGDWVDQDVFYLAWQFWTNETMGYGVVDNFTVYENHHLDKPLIKTTRDQVIDEHFVTRERGNISIINYTTQQYDLYASVTWTMNVHLSTVDLPNRVLINLSYLAIPINSNVTFVFLITNNFEFIDIATLSFRYKQIPPPLDFTSYIIIGFVLIGIMGALGIYLWYRDTRKPKKTVYRIED